MAKILKLAGRREPSGDAFTLLLLDAATGRVVRRIPGTRRSSWTR